MPGMHQELKLCKGIQVAPGDTGSAELGLTIIDLLTGSSEGFALDSSPGAWNPGVPAPKPGLWVDLPFTDGRTPFAGADMNVTETIRLIATAPTHLRMSQILRGLYAMQENCERFWQDEFTIEPVFLWWWATNAPGRQYALIMSLDIAVSVPTTDDGVTVVRDVTLTIEREPYWRGEVPPGANPILWTLYAQGKQPGRDYDYLADLRLVGTSSFPILFSLVNDTLENRVDYTTLTASVNTINSKNVLTIPAAKIPGDAPALVQLTLQHTSNDGPASGNFNYSFMVSQSSRKALATMRNNNIARFVTMLPFTAGTYTGGVAVQTDTGGVNGYNVTTSATIAFLSRLAITPGVSMAEFEGWTIGLSDNIERGRFAVFVRCRQNAGSAGDITLRVGFFPAVNNTGPVVYTNTVNAPLVAGTGNTDFFPLTYLGSVRLPPDRDALMSASASQGGSGLYNYSAGELYLSLQVARSTGVALLYFLDIILLPYDECMIDAIAATPSLVASGTVADTLVLDNTGYLSRGKPGLVGNSFNALASPASESTDAAQPGSELRGAELTLKPGVENNIYVLEYNQNTKSSPRSVIAAYANIVPRWRGIRDV